VPKNFGKAQTLDFFNMNNENRTILVSGLTSLKLGAMETDNLGNFLIAEAMFRSLRDYFPNAVIKTTLQMSSEFADRYNLQIVTSERFWMYTRTNYRILRYELFISWLWKIISKVGIKANFLLHTKRLKEFRDSDLVIDLHGDIFGDNVLTKYQFYMGALSPEIVKNIGKNIFCVASSPGPFGTLKRIKLALRAFNNYDHVSVREPVSLNVLNNIGFVGSDYTMHPCFSFGFRPYNQVTDEELERKEPELFKVGKTMVGLVVCTHNLKEMPLNKWPRDDREFEPFVELVTHLARGKGLRVCVLSHRYKFNDDNTIKLGSDHSMVDRILELLPSDVSENVFSINGIYDASSMNKIIGKFKVLMSGRIHGAVQGIQQKIPTVIIDYANEPKAHKLQGFANMTYLNEYIANPNSGESLISSFEKLWKDKEFVKDKLEKRVPEIVNKSIEVWAVFDRYSL